MYVRHLLNLTRVKTLVLWSRRLTSKQLQEKTHELLSLKKKLGIKNPWELSLSYSELQNLEFSSLPAKSVFIPRPRTVVCYTAVFSVVTQRSSPLTAAENRTTFLSRD